MGRFLKAMMAVAVLGAVGGLALLAIESRFSSDVPLQKQMEANRLIAMKARFDCPRGSSEIRRRWGWVGYERSCVAGGATHGPWAAWENGAEIRGQYARGKQDGEWQWLDRGVVTRTIRYDAGVEVYDSLVTNGSR
jgi:hypothetical protein